MIQEDAQDLVLGRQRETNTERYHLYVLSKKAALREIENRVVVTRGWRMGEMGRCWSKAINF